MQKLTLNVLLSLIIQSKVTGKGMTSNGRLFVMLMEIIADHNNKNLTSEENILNKFNNEVTHHDAYRKLERFLSRFIRTGQGYPYDLFSFEDFEDITKYSRFLHKMRSFVDIVIDGGNGNCEPSAIIDYTTDSPEITREGSVEPSL